MWTSRTSCQNSNLPDPFRLWHLLVWQPRVTLFGYSSPYYILEMFSNFWDLISSFRAIILSLPQDSNPIMNESQRPNRSRCFLESIPFGRNYFHFSKTSDTRGSQTRWDFWWLCCFTGVCKMVCMSMGVASDPSIDCEFPEGRVGNALCK